jgi:single-stranded-DNA-specific exonuclease
LFYQSGKYAASARSVKFDVYNALEACSEIWNRRSHVCCGNDVEGRKLSNLQGCFEKSKKETIHPDMLTPEIAVDAEIDFADISKINPNPETI